MKPIRQNSKALWNKYFLLISILGLLCILYLATTRTTEDEKLIYALKKYCFAHYALIKGPTPKNEYRFLRYEDRLARLSEGKFYYLNAKEVRAFLEPRGYVYEMEEDEGKVDYLLACFLREGYFEGGGADSISFDYFLLDRIFVYPYDRYSYDASWKKRDLSPLIFYEKNGNVYLNGGWIRRCFEGLFTNLWESRGTRVSGMKGPRWHRILYRGLEEIWKETRLYHRSRKTAAEYFIQHSFECYMPTMLTCVSREFSYRHRNVEIEKKLELIYLRSLMEDPNFITLGLLCYLGEVKCESWARRGITRLEAEWFGEWGFDDCSLEQISRAAGKALKKIS